MTEATTILAPGASPTLAQATPEQAAIVEAAGAPESQMVRAYAGCAKTTTLELAAKRVRKAALALAFNKSITKELQGRLPAGFEVKSLNALGFGALRRALPEVSKWDIQPQKLGRLVSEVDKALDTRLDRDQWGSARRLVTAAMQAGLVPQGYGDGGLTPDDPSVWTGLATDLWIPREDHGVLIDVAHETLRRSIDLTRQGVASYDDQIYHPLVLDGKFLQFPVVFVDEAQDLSPLNHEMIRRSLRPDSKLLAVGDPKQAIYAFRGADGASMDKVAGLRSEWRNQGLTLTFRCPRTVVARQQAHAPGYRAAESNSEGRVDEWPQALDDPGGEGVEADGWSSRELLAHANGDSVAILCRNNAPLLSLAFKLIRQGVSCWMIGRDIGKGLVTLSTKIPLRDDDPADTCRGKIETWRAREVELASLNDNDAQADSANDRAECLQAVLENVADGRALRAALTKLFAAETGRVCLSTIHKAKGLEWHTVVHLDPWRVPSPAARRAALRGDMVPLDQENNLRYVAETRAREQLVLASLEDFQ